MNKYQNYIFTKMGMNEKSFIFHRCCPIENEIDGTKKQYVSFNIGKDTLSITQDEDINKTEYVLIVLEKFGEVFVHKNKEWVKITRENEKYKIIVDFNDRIDAIKFVFANKLANDYVVKITYAEAGKEKYYAKKEQDHKDELLKKASIKVSAGADLVNIYFQPCCDKYDHTEVSLYIPKDHERVPGHYGSYDKPSMWSLIKKCKVPTEDFYTSINGLAYGEYAFILQQFDRKENIILETDYIAFEISKPVIPRRKPVVVI